MGVDHKYPMTGTELWTNAKNGFTVFQLHYTSDPSKRDSQTIKDIKRSMPIRQFMQEYELVWDSFEGLPVFADWDSTYHGVKGDIDPHIGLPLLLGMDFGLTPALIVCQMRDDGLKVLREFTAVNMGIKRFLLTVKPQLLQAYPQWADTAKDYIVFIDPSGEFRKDTDEGTCSNLIADAGFTKIVPGAISFEERRMSVENFLTRRTKTGPSFQVSLPNCPILVRGFQGGYRYSDTVIEKEPNKIRPLKDIHSHIHDSLQMVTSKILMTSSDQGVNVPSPSYSWAKNRDRL